MKTKTKGMEKTSTLSSEQQQNEILSRVIASNHKLIRFKTELSMLYTNPNPTWAEFRKRKIRAAAEEIEQEKRELINEYQQLNELPF